MNEPKAQGQEPSMEEILASIRRIISENDEPGGASAGSQAGAPSGSSPAPRLSAADEGVLDLTEMVGADGKVVSLAATKTAAPAQDPEPPPTQEFPPMVDPNLDAPAKPHSEVAADDVVLSSVEPVLAPASEQDDRANEALVGATTAAVSTAAFAALAKQLHRDGPASASVPIGSGRTLEDLVQEMIRPMLREWLDANLPGMVERMIKREIERIVRRAED
jgi:hypothetical protein